MNSLEQLDMILFRNSDDSFKCRKLEVEDFNKGYMELLAQLTVSPKCPESEWIDRFNEINENPLIKIIIIESTEESKIVGTITVLIEPKFLRNLGSVCHIEDVVVDKDHRTHKLGAKLIKMSLEFAKVKGCYKAILDCDDKVTGFYEKQGFSQKSIGMSLYFSKPSF